MRTKLQLAGIISMLFALLAFTPWSIRAQPSCSYQVANNLNCDVDVQVDMLTMPGCGICTTLYFSVASHSSMPFDPCLLGCVNLCNIRVTVINVGGAAASGMADFFVTMPPGNTVSYNNPGCGLNGSIVFDSANSFNINP